MKSNLYETTIPITRNALKVREWERKNLPIEQSSLALDIFLLISYNTLINTPLTLKGLFHSLDYSEAGIRRHLRRFLTEEWCHLIGGQEDRRSRLVVAKPKMLFALAEYSKILSEAFERLQEFELQE